MVNIKWGIIAAIAAFIVSIGLGFISGVNVLFIFIRAAVFSAVFFGLGFGLRFVISVFFPELLTLEDEQSGNDDVFEQAGSKVDITLDTTGEYAVPELYKVPGDSEELGNIEDLVSGYYASKAEKSAEQPSVGIDRDAKEGYNNERTVQFEEMPVFSENSKKEEPVFTPSFGDDSAGLGGLPDLDAMAMVFSSGGGDSSAGHGAASGFSAKEPEPVMASHEELEPASRGYISSKPQPMKGDFDPKELAEGLRSILHRDK